MARLDDRRVISGIFHILRRFHNLHTGAPWRALPKRYAPRTTVYNRDDRWAKAGFWLPVFEAVAEQSP